MKVQLQYFEGCPGHLPTRALIQAILTDLDVPADLEEIDVTSSEPATSIGFCGSPTLSVNGRDIEDRTDAIVGMGCRVYDGKPVPARWLVEAAVIRAIKPKKLLFMCVQNSARSQLAEAIGRHLAPEGVEVISAGSQPAFVRPQAIQVLEEAGISADGLVSQAVDDVDTSGVEVVVTLCADEVCPLYLGKAHRLHWGLDDPAKVEPEQAKMEKFRAVRDELLKRLAVMMKYTVE
jgi:arsenate reductase (thioredoxin)